MLNLHELNEAQRKAVTWEGGPLLVLAGPGSGKTKCIVGRIAYLLERGVAPEKILVITFTKDAARSMQARFVQSSDSYIPVNFGTFHSFFYQILKQSNDSFASHILTQSEKIRIMIPLLKKFLTSKNVNDATESLWEDAGLLLDAISYYKNTGSLEEATLRAPAAWQESFGDLLEAYQRKSASEKAIDFDDMLFRCKTLLSDHPRIRKMWQERFSHILIDEFQDINPVQYDILKLLAKAPYQIFAVGDDDQSIYGFRGASTRCIRQFVEEFSAKQIVLDVNYRSKKLLIDQAKAVIEMSKDRFAKTLRAGRADAEGGACEILSFQNREEEYTWLGERIKEEWGTQKTVGVLFRTNAAMQKFAAYLRRYEIPYVMKEQEKSIYDHFVFRDLWAYLSLARGDRSKENLLRILNKPYRGIDRELVPCSGMTLLNRQLKTIEKFPLHLAVEYICKQVGYERYLLSKAGNSRETWEEWSELLAWVKSEARQYASLKEWELARAFSKKHQMAKANQSNIHLMTAHASKGLEFDCVYLPNCNEGTYPYGRMPDDAAVEEELRIFYVAMTRAKNSLGLLYLTGTEQSPRHPSRFIQPLLHPR